MKKKIIVVGGGTAGWISLAYLAATTDAELIIIHSNEVDTIGVGESTTPTIKHVAEACGVNEATWMKDGKATFKYGIEFLNFNKPGSRWLHTFDDLLPGQSFHTPITEFGKNIFKKEISSVEYFLFKRAQGDARFNANWFNNSHGGSEFLLEHKLSPYTPQGNANFSKFPGYSYHINAAEFGNSLKKHTPKERYTEIQAHIEGVEYDEAGVKYIVLKDGTKMSADLYIDCTGFKKLLIGSMTKFKPYVNLLNNSAIFGNVKEQIIRPSTISEAQPHGWIWEIPTQEQIGSGYVFSDNFISVEKAENHIREHWKKKGMEWNPVKAVKFTSGRLENVAVKNVIANGLGQGFIEPLEATSIMVACTTIRNVSKLFNKINGWDHKSSKILTTVMNRFLDQTKEFVLGHYTLSDRRDTDYWQAYDRNNTLENISKVIEHKLEKEWVAQGETVFNGYNWTSMLLGYEKPYIGKLPNIEEWQLENYEFYTKQLVENYRYMYSKNISIEERLKIIHN
jgi:tryptophan halogenase